MDRVHFELIVPYRLADLRREADAERHLAHVPRRPFAPTLGVAPLLIGFGRLLVDAGIWLQRLDRPCPDCPAPVH
jgi:hypothetical protein